MRYWAQGRFAVPCLVFWLYQPELTVGQSQGGVELVPSSLFTPGGCVTLPVELCKKLCKLGCRENVSSAEFSLKYFLLL